MSDTVKKVLIVFLVVVVIGAVMYPEDNFQKTIRNIKNEIKPIIKIIDLVNDSVNSFLNIFNQEGGYGDYNEVISEIDKYYIYLSEYTPYYLELYDLTDRAANQGLSIYTSKLEEIHNLHKVSFIHVYFDYEFEFGVLGVEQIDCLIYYWCGVCEKICAITYSPPIQIGFRSEYFLYSEQFEISNGSKIEFEVPMGLHSVLSVTNWSEVLDYYYDVYPEEKPTQSPDEFVGPPEAT